MTMPQRDANLWAPSLPGVELVDLRNLAAATGETAPPIVAKQMAAILWRLIVAVRPDWHRYVGTGPIPWHALPLDQLPAPILDFRPWLRPCRVKRSGFPCPGLCSACWPPPVFWTKADMLEWLQKQSGDPGTWTWECVRQPLPRTESREVSRSPRRC